MEGALFSTECVYDPQFEAVLRLEPPRSHEDNIHAPAHMLLEQLLHDLDARGLKLGHGVNRGFGWFSVKWEREVAP